MNLRLLKINGTLSPIYKQLRVQYDPQRGRQIIQEWESAGVGLAGVAALCEQERIAYDHTANRVRSRLVATSSGPQAGTTELVIDSWQLLANELQTAIKEHPYFGALSRATIGSIQADADAIKRGDLPVSSIVYDTIGTVVETALLDFLVKDQTHYAQGQWVLKHTANVANNFLGLAEIVGEEQIYTTAQLLTEIESGWTYNCPVGIRAKINLVGTTKAGAAHTNYLWGWRKLPSTDTTAANSRRDISYEYWFGEWSTILYAVFP